MTSKALDVKHQLVFYGQYHSNKYNVAIHMVFVPIILWTTLIIQAHLPWPDFLPKGTYDILPPYLSFGWNWAVPFAAVYGAYYVVLEPVAGLLYLPLLSTMLLTATSLATTTWGLNMAAWLWFAAWIAQFAGHGLAEKRSPALLDNLVGALVLAPFFVHLEILFAFGYRPQFHKEIMNGVGVEIAKFRREQANAERAKKL